MKAVFKSFSCMLIHIMGTRCAGCSGCGTSPRPGSSRVTGGVVCGICGETEATRKILVEGTVLNVCVTCAKFGEEVRTPQEAKRKQGGGSEEEDEVEHEIVPDFGKLIRLARERLELSQPAFGKLVNEKESVILRMESGKMVPDLKTARKLERALKLKLVLEPAEVKAAAAGGKKAATAAAGAEKKGKAGLTLGDVVKVK